jgi:hypothetical protein
MKLVTLTSIILTTFSAHSSLWLTMTFITSISAQSQRIDTPSFLSISGLNTPTQVIYDKTTGLIFISEKGGAIKAVSNAFKTIPESTIAYHLTTLSVDTDGQHGLTSIAINGSYLYALYHASNTTNPTCISNGAIPSGKTAKDVYGCVTRVILSRFPIITNITSYIGYSLGTEFLLLNSAANAATSNMSFVPSHCSQFGFSGANHILFNDINKDLLISVGVGANEDGLESDIGQYGGDPCGIPNGKVNSSGFLRAQVLTSLMGKIISLSSSSIETFVNSPYSSSIPSLLLQVKIIAIGLRNPWRMLSLNTLTSSKLVVIDPGLENFEEVNDVTLSSNNNGHNIINFGFPCIQGNVFVNSFATNDICSSPLFPFTPSSILYTHPLNRGTFSALAYDSLRSRYILADYSNSIVFSIPSNFSLSFSTLPLPLTSLEAETAGIIIEALPAFASHIESIQIGTMSTHLLVDVVKGTIKSKNLWATPIPSSNPSATPKTPVTSGSTVVTVSLLLLTMMLSISLSTSMYV